MSLAFDPRVEDDLADAAVFYESRSPGLGEDFLTEARRAFDQILAGPARWPKLEGGPVRRYLLVRFPYAVHYRDRPDQVLILSVTHTKRHPDAWKRRL